MWPFSRKPKDISQLPAISADSLSWGIAEGTFDGAPIIIRFSLTAREWSQHPALPIRLGFAIPLNSPNEGGLPDPSENRQVKAVEDIILSHVSATTKGIWALVLTTGIMKEFIFYIPVGVDIKSLHMAIKAAVKTHDVQCLAEEEPKWTSYKNWVPH